jgi:signal transduction histidine kinase
MAEQLRRNMVTDVAHELRTPVSNIRGQVEAIKDNDWCLVSVIDHGIGINPEDQKMIFEPFFQLEAAGEKEVAQVKF